MIPWYEVVGFIALGFGVGTYGTMVGVGGGFLMVPVFLVMHQPARVAAGTSLAVVLANGISGTITFFRQKRIDLRTGLVFSLAGVPGALLGAYVDQHIAHRTFTILFGILLAGIGIRIFVTRGQPAGVQAPAEPGEPVPAGYSGRDFVDAHGVRHTYRYNILAGIAISALTGFLASLFGIGGGIVQVPAMVLLFHFPAHIAAATSAFIIAVTALFGTASHVYFGDVLFVPALLLAIGAIAGAQLGARIALQMKAGPLMQWLSLALVATAVYLIAVR